MTTKELVRATIFTAMICYNYFAKNFTTSGSHSFQFTALHHVAGRLSTAPPEPLF